MSSFLLVLKLASRAGIWRTTRLSRLAGLPSLLGWLAGLGVLRMLVQLAEAGSGAGFNPYGLNAVVAWLALEAAVAALFVPPAARCTALSAMFALTLVGEVVFEAVTHTAPQGRTVRIGNRNRGRGDRRRTRALILEPGRAVGGDRPARHEPVDRHQRTDVHRRSGDVATRRASDDRTDRACHQRR